MENEIHETNDLVFLNHQVDGDEVEDRDGGWCRDVGTDSRVPAPIPTSPRAQMNNLWSISNQPNFMATINHTFSIQIFKYFLL